MAAYAALASLSQTTDLTINKHQKPLFSIDVEEKIRSIHEYVTVLLSFLEDFPAKAKRWEGKVRDLAHQTEDLIDVYVTEEQSRNGKRKLPGMEFEEQLGNVMEKMCLMAGDVMDERPAYLPLAVSSSSSSSSIVAPTGNGVVIGLADDVMAIKERLCGMSSKLQVIPILGMGGIGKTTLARTVYDDPLIIGYFHIRVWLTISQDYSVGKVLLRLLDSIKQQMCLGVKDSKILGEEQMCRKVIDDSMMAEKVYKKLKGRRYLIVMDDVWSTKVWDDVRNIFPDDGNGSQIMLTTRLADLAAYPQSSIPPHEMRFMKESQSWDLLKGKVFAETDCPQVLEDIGKEIIRRCAGLPLAVVLVAGFLSAVDKTLSSWKGIAKNVHPIIGQESEGILSVSYTQLPHHLRPCFLFLGAYPEDENIRASSLTRLWIAERFLKPKNGCSKSLEDEAEEYLEDLVKRNLVLVTSRKSDRKIKSCSLHDMVRDLCIRKAKEEKFLRALDDHDFSLRLVDERRISLNRFSYINSIWGSTIRTILSFPTRNIPIVPALLRHVRLLRVFDAIGTNSENPPYEVYELFHLRYLVLVCTSTISPAISTLMNLQTLIILRVPGRQRRYRKVGQNVSHLYLPMEIWGMPQLRHLVLHHLCKLPQPPDGSNLPLENLHTLFYIKNLVWNEKIVQMIPNVRRLGLVYQIKKEYHLYLVKHLHQLEKLEVYGLGNFSWPGRNLAFPTSLKKLILVGGGFLWEDMSIIGSLPNLQVLKLLHYACNGETWETTDGEFPQLRYLLIEESQLEHWISESSHFPRLKCLVLRCCTKLREIPASIGEIPTLELIEVNRGNYSLVKSANQIKEDQESYGNYSLQISVKWWFWRLWPL